MGTFIFYKHFKFDRPLRTPPVSVFVFILDFLISLLIPLGDKAALILMVSAQAQRLNRPVSSTRLELWKRKQLLYRSSLVCHWNSKGWREGCWWIIITVQKPPPVCLPLLISLTSPDSQNVALLWSRLQRRDHRLAAAWGEVSNDCLLLF